MSDHLAAAHLLLGNHLPKIAIADLPTPVSVRKLAISNREFDVAVKHDDVSSELYGGNKVRKLEYLLRRAQDRGAQRVATFGAAGSNHALATAMHANDIALECTCFLSHQARTPKIPIALNMHRRLGTEIVRFGSRIKPVPLFRKYLQHRNAWVIPVGGTCWLGSVGFVNAGLELAEQVRQGLLPKPTRIYIGCGTTGSAAGLAIGLAAARLDTVVHAVQVADPPFSCEEKLRRLMEKTRFILNRIDPTFDAPGMQDRLTWRGGFLAGGYARVDDATSDAVATARKQLDITLETTYTGKAMAAMLHDLQAADYAGEPYLFWNTFNSSPLPVTGDTPDSLDNIPAEFARYYGTDK